MTEKNIISKNYNCAINILSPVHIASGDSYSSYECFYPPPRKDGKRLVKRINLSKYFVSLSDDYKEEFLKEIVNPGFKLNEFNKNYNEKTNEEVIRLNKFVKNKREIKELKLNDFVRYVSLNKTKSSNDINEHIKTMDSLYIPGSSLKGAISNALIYNSIYDEQIEEFIKYNNKKKTKFLKSNQFESKIQSYFSYNDRDPIKRNVMKFLQVSDSSLAKNPTIFEVVSLLLEYDENNNYKGVSESVNTLVEALWYKKKLNTNFRFQYNEDILDFEGAGAKHVKYLNIDYVKKAAYNFSKDLIAYESDFARKFGLGYLEEFYKGLNSKNTKETPILRLGWGTGLLSKSVALKIKNYDEGIYMDMFNVKDSSEYPKSKRIAVTKKEPLEGMPLGWVQLKFEEI